MMRVSTQSTGVTGSNCTKRATQKAPVATWGLTHLMTDRMARIAPKPVWVAIALGYLSALLSAVTVDPASATLMMMSV